MATPDPRLPGAHGRIPRMTSQALSMRPETFSTFLALTPAVIFSAALIGAAVAYAGSVAFGAAHAATSAAVWGGFGAFAAAVVGVISLPVARRLVISREDVRLVEAASPLHPLLKRLMIEAPGTYAHSLAVASLAEAGAEVVGADGLLARVGAYYHDVGKIKRPCFFFENLGDGQNPHDSAKPSLSVMIITAHVNDGLDLAAEYDLPDRVRDVIREHHGTSLVKYFFHKAAQEDAGVYEGDFRYHGGKPSSKEAALVMLADSCEAAVRALSGPGADDIAMIVRGVLTEKLDDGQLEHSGLELQQIERLSETFTRMLVGMLHARCEYPRAFSATP